MFQRVFALTISSVLLLFPNIAVAQFGLGNRRQQGGTGFQEMQELAKKQQEVGAAGGGADVDMAKLLEEAMKDPVAMEYMEKMGHDINKAMDQLSKMTPEEIEKQMSEAFGALTDDKMLEAIMGSKEEVLKQMELMGMIPADELAKMKADPAYFDAKMKESWSQMQTLFQNPEMAQYMTQALTSMTEMFQKGGTLMDELEKFAGSGDLSDDKTIEEARRALLDGDLAAKNPMLKKLLDNDEMKSILKDTKKFRESVKEGRKVLGLKDDVGARIGEL
ncbi:hypothetical protein ACA910_006223 [Epithemia clementina (nom. ined.)]